jgi:hypothetical protein
MLIAQILENQLSGLIEGNEVWVKLIGTLMLTMRCKYGTAVELDSLETLRLSQPSVSHSNTFRVLIVD